MPGLTFRDAAIADLPGIIAMYADDEVGRTREALSDPLPEAYLTAFRDIAEDPRHRLVVAEEDGEVVATLQLSFLPHLAMLGTQRAQVEAIRVRSDRRNQGVGQELMAWAIAQARANGCGIVQLTTMATRIDSHRFYERLGFVPSHIGMKLDLQHL